jgi:hypothetical protein
MHQDLTDQMDPIPAMPSSERDQEKEVTAIERSGRSDVGPNN